MRQAVFVLRDICPVEFAPVPRRMVRQEKRCGLVRLFQGRKCTRSCDNSPKWKQCNHGNGSFLRSRVGTECPGFHPERRPTGTAWQKTERGRDRRLYML